MSLDQTVLKYWAEFRTSLGKAYTDGWEGIQTVRWVIVAAVSLRATFDIFSVDPETSSLDGWILVSLIGIGLVGVATYGFTILAAPFIGYARAAYRNRKVPIMGTAVKKKQTNMFGDE